MKILVKLLPEYVGESFDTDAWKACLTDGILRLVIDAYDQAQSLIMMFMQLPLAVWLSVTAPVPVTETLRNV